MAKNYKLLSIVSFIISLMFVFSFFCFAEGEEEQPPTVPEQQVTEAPAEQPAPEQPAQETPQEQPQQPAQTQAAQPASNSRSSDNALKSMTVVGFTESGERRELSVDPAFSPTLRTYNLTVPYEIVKLEISVDTNDSKAKVNIPIGYLNLDVGTNKSYVYVTAENGSRRTYQINTVRNEQQETTTELVTEEPTTEIITLPPETTTEIDVIAPEIENSGMNIYTKLGIVFGVGGLLMLALAVPILRKNKKNTEDSDK